MTARNLRTALVFALMSLGAGCSATGGTTSSDRLATVESLTGSTTSGQSLYSSTCASCHGAAGGGGSAPSLRSADETMVISTMLSGKSRCRPIAVSATRT